jgi:hypothetical protein
MFPFPKFHTHVLMLPLAEFVNTTVNGEKPFVTVLVTVPAAGGATDEARVNVIVPF